MGIKIKYESILCTSHIVEAERMVVVISAYRHVRSPHRDVHVSKVVRDGQLRNRKLVRAAIVLPAAIADNKSPAVVEALVVEDLIASVMVALVDERKVWDNVLVVHDSVALRHRVVVVPGGEFCISDARTSEGVNTGDVVPRAGIDKLHLRGRQRRDGTSEGVPSDYHLHGCLAAAAFVASQIRLRYVVQKRNDVPSQFFPRLEVEDVAYTILSSVNHIQLCESHTAAYPE